MSTVILFSVFFIPMLKTAWNFYNNTQTDVHKHQHSPDNRSLYFYIFGKSFGISVCLNYGPHVGKFFSMFVQVFVGRGNTKSRCSYSDKGNISGSPEFRPGKDLTDKKNEKVSSLATAIQLLFLPPTHLFHFSNLIFCFFPSSIFPPPHAEYLTLLFIPVSANVIPFILHYSPFTQFLRMFPLYLVFDIYIYIFSTSPLLEPHLRPFIPYVNYPFDTLNPHLMLDMICMHTCRAGVNI